MKTCGLTLGKYAPFHKGHQFVFDTALAEVDELVVLIYATDVIDIPLSVRSRWIRQLYPNVSVIECWDGPKGYSTERAYEIAEENYIIKMLAGKEITHFYSSEFYGDHVSRALGAVDRRVDTARCTVPISATQIRNAPFDMRALVDTIVYFDMLIKVVFVGAMSTGKSTLVEALAKRYQTSFAAEYGREYWTEHQVNRRIALHEFDLIAKGHMEREKLAARDANKYLFVDTNAVTTFMYCQDYHGEVTPYLQRTALENPQRYDLWFLCEDDIPYDDTWDRSGPQKRSVFQQKIIADLLERKIPFIRLAGSLDERINTVDRVLTRFGQYSNYFGEKQLL
ncbi:MAG TPA: AAA family ATPase [Cellvibrionaceae bacterium]|nr:AAA family ATPase [Cellvibrionaceae bacterium]HMW46870.1 AAA family ATPase [Cellvibrionaceae bacterium]HMY38799.1 AAA family ATPase [Marinagarivorans sp.]HNG58467.1 AAA family ATPase [Cellvibrionaceae bacterium]